MEHARHVFRVALVLGAVLAAVLVTRGFLVPKSYGMYGPYRYDNVVEQMNLRAPVHRGPAACGECHDEQSKKRAAGSHKGVSCEICHGPLALHVKDDGSVEPPPVDRSYGLCARCHRKIEGRPASFPQVVLEQHVSGPVEGQVCLGCHDPHSPKL
ncbi:cytochrome C [Anaeromyxobacter diazotrophicus]|uniref:Cytochrome c n=1 Tax=Anaeromyxobacter diazotrophicus TaxID=2590199 RepID=A0A7I9VKF3_9BACT|nr:cytochrome C [Anaeromyxobacter diazotrophicus]GEJ56855.1 cytochrome c [Anaeromyxobacter diazotrophicus]